MWYSSVLVCFAVLTLQILAQPLLETIEDARDKRQLDLGECCPCPRPNEERSLRDQFATSNDHGFAVIPSMDDCPCRGKGDSEGAASIFFPTAMRSSGLVRPAERNEELKPLLHPEVDLAASVLQTLRDATDEEYRDALERDAVRSNVREAENAAPFGTNPLGSSPNILNIVMNPRYVDNDDDNMAETSHNHESRFVNNLSEPAAVLSKLRDSIKLSRNQPANIQHNRLFDMDSHVGASNIQENKIKLSSDSDVSPDLRTYAPAMRTRPDLSQKLNLSKNKFFDQKLDLQSSQLRNKLNIFNKPAPVEDVRDKTANNLHILRNNALNKLLSKTNQDDSKTIIQTKQDGLSENTMSLNRAKIMLKNKEYFNDLKIRPSKTSKTNLINLPKLTSDLNNDVIDVNEDIIKKQKTKQVPLLLKETVDDDPIVSPSTIIMTSQDSQNGFDECDNNNIESQITLKEKVTDKDHRPNVLNSQLVSKYKPISDEECSDYLEPINNSENIFESSNENEVTENITPKYTVQTLPKTQENTELFDETKRKLGSSDVCNEDPETHSIIDVSETSKHRENPKTDFLYQAYDADEKNENVSQSDETTTSLVLVKDVQGDEVEEIPTKDQSNEERNFENSSENDLVNSPSNNDEQVINLKETDTRETGVIMTCNDDSNNIDLTSLENKNEDITMTPPSSETPIGNIKDNIMKKWETIKSPAQNILNKKNLNVDKPTTSPPVPRETLSIGCNKDSITSESQQLISSNEIVENTTPLNNYDSQKTSKSNISGCNTNLQETSTLLESKDANSEEKDFEDIEDSAPLQTEVEKELKDRDNLKDHIDRDPICKGKFKNTQGNEVDSNSQASETILNRVPFNPHHIGTPFRLADTLEPTSNILNLLKNPVKLPDIHDIMKTGEDLVLEGLKLNVFEGSDSQKNLLQPLHATDSLSNLNPLMVAESSKTDFRSNLPLQGQSILNPAKLNLRAQKIDLPFLEDLSIKPVKLQPIRLDGSIFGRNLESQSKSEALRSKLQNLKNNLGVPTKLNYENGMIQEKESKDFLKVVAPNKNKDVFQSFPRFFDSRLEKVPNNLLKKPHDLLEVLSRNHEDVNDKLRALHMDLNDRIDSMRNNLMDRTKLLYDESPKKSILKTPHQYFSTQKERNINLSPKTKYVTDTRQKQRNNTPKVEEKISKSLFTKDHDIHKIKKPLVTSPKTLQSPEVRTASGKSLSSPQASKTKPNVQNKGDSKIPSLMYDSANRYSQSNSRLRDTPKKKHNLFKDSKVTVTISSTPQPKLMRKINVKDSSGSPSENLQTLTQPSLIREAKDNSNESPTKQSKPNLPSKTLLPKTNNSENKKIKSIESGPRISSLKQSSWPEKGDSAFLEKVREALKTRRAKDNLKISDKPGEKLFQNQQEMNSNTDMTRSASENIDVIDGEPLKENIGYTCKMVCTKDLTVLKD